MESRVIIVVAYDDMVRDALVRSLVTYAATAVSCATFSQAESYLLTESCQGVLVDLVTMVKAKGEEKLVAFALTSFFPTLRVKAMGTMLVPMTMSGDARQDKSLSDFLDKTCAGFIPRRLRFHRRREICLPVLISGEHSGEAGFRGFTQNISWGGAFIVVMNPELFEAGQMIELDIPGFRLMVTAVVVWIVPWGGQRASGIGVKFMRLTEEIKGCLSELLHSSEEDDHDRLSA